MSSNIFNLPNPGTWSCRILNLAPGHGLLTIKLTNRSVKTIVSQIEFVHVEYFAGWTVWKGANFRVGTESELVDLARRITPTYKMLSDQELLSLSPFVHNSLFICETVDDASIYIIANGGRTADAAGSTVVEPLNFGYK